MVDTFFKSFLPVFTVDQVVFSLFFIYMETIQGNRKTKFNQSLYNKGLDYNSIDGSEAIKLNQYKSKFNQTGDAAYIMMFNYHINKINERNKRKLAKRLLLRKVGSRVA